MYVVSDHESYVLYTKTEGGNHDQDPDSGSAKCVHIPTGPDHAEIRVGHSKAPGRSMDSPQMTWSGRGKNPPR
eukprot:6543550-Lingulodinium_polyedra.AAC.1